MHDLYGSRLGEAQTKEKENRIKIRYIDPSSGIPYVTLTFNYRPRGGPEAEIMLNILIFFVDIAMLQAQGLISIKQDVSKTACHKRLHGEEADPNKRPRADDGKGHDVKHRGKDTNVKDEDKDAELTFLLVSVHVLITAELSSYVLDRPNATQLML